MGSLALVESRLKHEGLMSRGKMSTGGPHPVDIHVGQRVRMRRNEVGMSQTNLADGLGITFQQVQKYERGTNRNNVLLRGSSSQRQDGWRIHGKPRTSTVL